MARRIDFSKLPPDMLLSDVERDGAVEILREHMGSGRITLEDYEARVAAVYASDTAADIQVPLQGLPIEPLPRVAEAEGDEPAGRRWLRRSPRVTRTRVRVGQVEVEAVRTAGPVDGPRVRRLSIKRTASARSEPDPVDPATELRLEGEIEFDNVSFAYPGTRPRVLDDVSFRIAGGETTAIFGESGSGKSTIAHLLIRHADPTAGRIVIDGTNLRDFPLEAYRKRLGVVAEEDFLFSGTVASNLGFADDGATRRRMAEALDAVGLGPTLVRRGGLDAVVQEQGRNFTTAERQLIAFARALVRRPDIVILDDALSRLDGPTAIQVLDAFAALERTTLVITSDKHIADRARRVIVLDDGRVIG